MRHVLIALVVLAGLGTPTRAWAYLEISPVVITLGRVVSQSTHIGVLEVDRVSREKQAIIYKKVADLKGKDAEVVVKHKLTAGFHPREVRTILDWAQPGAIAICFQTGQGSVTCIGRYWYVCTASTDSWWTMTAGKPILSYAFSGSVARLRDHVTALLAGRETVITALKYRLYVGKALERKLEHWDTIEAMGSGRLMRGKAWPLCRIKASLAMPGELVQLLRDTDLLLGDGPAGPGDVPVLVKALQHKDARIRLEAAEDLGMIAPPAAGSVPALLELCEHDADPLVRLAAAGAVAGIDPKNGKALAILVEALKDRTGRVRQRAAECLGDLGPRARSAVAALAQAVADPDSAVGWAAIDALGQIGPDAESAVPILIEALQDAGNRAAAIDALGQIGRKAQRAVAALEKVLEGDDRTVRWAAAASLVKIGGPGLERGVRYLLARAKREGGMYAYNATHLLIAPTARPALPVLVAAVRDTSVRDLACQIAFDASMYLPATKDPLADVKGLLEDRDAGVRCAAGWVLYSARAVEIKDALAVLRGTLKAADPWARRQAVRYLGTLGSAAREAAAEVSALLKDSDEGVRAAAGEALKSMQRK
jgi:HEAT repeat protein